MVSKLLICEKRCLDSFPKNPDEKNRRGMNGERALFFLDDSRAGRALLLLRVMAWDQSEYSSAFGVEVRVYVCGGGELRCFFFFFGFLSDEPSGRYAPQFQG